MVYGEHSIYIILMVSIMLHNMIIKDERGEQPEHFLGEAYPLLTVHRGTMPWTDFLAATKALENSASWAGLENNLVEHQS